METVYIGIGGNTGEREDTFGAALLAVERLENTAVIHVSRLYESAPWGVADQPMFANAVAELSTSVPADALLDALKEIEREMGREEGPLYGPRPVDLDILLYGTEEWSSERLTIPHPLMLERDFVVTPLLEIAPHAELPNGEPVTRKEVKHGPVTGILGAVPGFEDRTPLQNVTGSRPAYGRSEGEDWVQLTAFGDWLVNSMKAQSAPDVSFLLTVLDQERIPYSWDPYPPEDCFNPYGFSARFKLMVPKSFEAQASRLVDEVARAKIDWTDPGLSG